MNEDPTELEDDAEAQERSSCSQCGAPIPGPPGIAPCPACTMQLAARPANAAGAGARAALSPEDVAERLPQYEILGLLGRGGMGAVYRAKQRKLDRTVAIKVLSPAQDEGAQAEFDERFEREARALARLDHPGIVGIYDFGDSGGLYYLVMQFVDGASLRELMSTGRITTSDALEWVPQICDALQYAHDRGVVHRDIKPENILIDGEGRVRVADFGLAKLQDADRASIGLTKTRHALGTPHYMAPEQVGNAHAVDHRADLYALGVVIYEMLTGELPLGHFAAPSAKAAANARFDPIVRKALAADPGQRFESAVAIKTELESKDSAQQSASGSLGAATSRRANTGSARVKRPTRSTAIEGALAEKAKRDIPIYWAIAGGTLVALFLPWGTATLNYSQLVHLSAWQITIAGLPLWLTLVAAVSIALMNHASSTGRRIPQAVPLLTALAGAGLSFWCLSTATLSRNVTTGLGHYVLCIMSVLLLARSLPRPREPQVRR